MHFHGMVQVLQVLTTQRNVNTGTKILSKNILQQVYAFHHRGRKLRFRNQ